jgi:hypothetical protein
MLKKFFHLSLLLLFLHPGSGIRDPGSGMGKNQDPGSGINIPDPPHWLGILCKHTKCKILNMNMNMNMNMFFSVR